VQHRLVAGCSRRVRGRGQGEQEGRWMEDSGVISRARDVYDTLLSFSLTAMT
jgi:hypothetical protein